MGKDELLKIDGAWLRHHIFILPDDVVSKLCFDWSCDIAYWKFPCCFLKNRTHGSARKGSQFPCCTSGGSVTLRSSERIEAFAILDPLDEFPGKLFRPFLCSRHFCLCSHCSRVRDQNMARFDFFNRCCVGSKEDHCLLTRRARYFEHCPWLCLPPECCEVCGIYL